MGEEEMIWQIKETKELLRLLYFVFIVMWLPTEYFKNALYSLQVFFHPQKFITTIYSGTKVHNKSYQFV